MDLRDIAFYVHVAALAVALFGVLYADKVGFAWLRGKVTTISPRTLQVLHDVMSLSLATLILSGLYLFWPMREYLLTQPFFLAKLAFVIALVINSLVIDKLMNVAVKLPFAEVSGTGKVVLFLSGAVSFACWAGAVTTAFLLFGLDPIIDAFTF